MAELSELTTPTPTAPEPVNTQAAEAVSEEASEEAPEEAPEAVSEVAPEEAPEEVVSEVAQAVVEVASAEEDPAAPETTEIKNPET